MDFFRKVKDSFTRFDVYRDIVTQGLGKTFRYFFLLFTLIFIIQGLQVGVGFNAGLTEFASTVRDKMPEFSLSGGKLAVEGKQPIIYTGDNNSAMFIDTTGQLDESVLDKYNDGVFISQDKILNKQGVRQTEIAFADFPQFSFNKAQLMNFLPMIKWILLVIGVFGYFFGAAWILINTVILGLLGLVINSTNKNHLLTFSQTWRMAIYAITLPLLLELLVNLIYPALPYFSVIKWVLAVFLMFKAIVAVVKYAGMEPPPPELQ